MKKNQQRNLQKREPHVFPCFFSTSNLPQKCTKTWTIMGTCSVFRGRHGPVGIFMLDLRGNRPRRRGEFTEYQVMSSFHIIFRNYPLSFQRRCRLVLPLSRDSFNVFSPEFHEYWFLTKTCALNLTKPFLIGFNPPANFGATTLSTENFTLKSNGTRAQDRSCRHSKGWAVDLQKAAGGRGRCVPNACLDALAQRIKPGVFFWVPSLKLT